MRTSKRPAWLPVLLVISAFLAFPALVMGATLDLQPGPEGKDCGLQSLNPSTNYGSTEWFNAIGLPGYGMGLAGFDVSSIPPGSIVLSAEIILWAEYRDGTLTLSPIASAWDEMTVTWSTQPAIVTPSMDVTYPISRGVPTGPCYWGCTWPFDITQIVQYWVDNPSLNLGLRVLGNTGSVGWLMASSDNISGYPRPRLTIQYDLIAPSSPATWGRLKLLYR